MNFALPLPGVTRHWCRKWKLTLDWNGMKTDDSSVIKNYSINYLKSNLCWSMNPNSTVNSSVPLKLPEESVFSSPTKDKCDFSQSLPVALLPSTDVRIQYVSGWQKLSRLPQLAAGTHRTLPSTVGTADRTSLWLTQANTVENQQSLPPGWLCCSLVTFLGQSLGHHRGFARCTLMSCWFG